MLKPRRVAGLEAVEVRAEVAEIRKTVIDFPGNARAVDLNADADIERRLRIDVGKPRRKACRRRQAGNCLSKGKARHRPSCPHVESNVLV